MTCSCIERYFFVKQVLYNEFVGHINQLKDLDAKLQKRVEKLEETAEREAVAHTCKVNELHKSNQLAFSHLQVIATKHCLWWLNTF